MAADDHPGLFGPKSTRDWIARILWSLCIGFILLDAIDRGVTLRCVLLAVVAIAVFVQAIRWHFDEIKKSGDPPV